MALRLVLLRSMNDPAKALRSVGNISARGDLFDLAITEMGSSVQNAVEYRWLA